MGEREQIEDALKFLYTCEEEGVVATLPDLSRAVSINSEVASELIDSMRAAQLVTDREDGPALTEAGREYALQVVRSHRLYETYLAHRTGFRTSTWHRRAHVAEHALTPVEADNLSASLGYPSYDPHGDPIPTGDGTVPPRRGRPLSEVQADWRGYVVHVEDEPATVYRRLAREGFAPDVRLRVECVSPDGMTVRIDGHSASLSPEAVAQVLVNDLPQGEVFDERVIRLSDLVPGQEAEVVGISPLIRGLARSRLLDLGMVPGTVLAIDLVGPAGEPVAYHVRGASIALRREQSDRILVRRKEKEGS